MKSGIVIHVHVLSSANVCLSNAVSNILVKPGNQIFCISHVFIYIIVNNKLKCTLCGVRPGFVMSILSLLH